MGYLRYLSMAAGAAMLLYVLWPARLDHVLKTPFFWQKAIGQLKIRMAAHLRSQKLHGWAALGMLNGLLP